MDRASFRFPVIALCALLAACDGTTDPDEPVLGSLAGSLASAATFVEFSEAQSVVTGYSGVISQLLATDGFPLGCSDCHTGGPSIAPRGSIAGVVAAIKRETVEPRAHEPVFGLDGSTHDWSMVPVRANLLGTTCVWNPDRDFWGNDPSNPYGDPPADAVNFEVYQSSNRRPIVPLVPLGGFATVAPRSQGPAVDVGGSVTLDGVELIGFQAAGNAPAEGIFDVDVSGQISGDEEISYASELTQDEAGGSSATQTTVFDVSIEELVSFTVGGSGGLDLDVERTGTQPQSLTFDLDLAAPDLLSISQGQVLYGGVPAAAVTGSLSNPQITILEGSPIPADEADLLRQIFENASIITGGIFEHVLFGTCVGTLDHSVCSQIDPGVPAPPQ